MFKYFKLHKQAKELLKQGAELVDKSKYTELEKWEVKRFVLKAVPLADECSKVALPNDAAGLYVCANMLDNHYNKGVLINEETYTQFINLCMIK